MTAPWVGPNGLPVYRRLQRKRQLRQRSISREAQMRLYRREVAVFLAQHQFCEFPLGCGARSETVHHKRGRFGKRLRDQRYWAASCAFHNDYAETHTGEALDCGWLLRIEGVQ